MDLFAAIKIVVVIVSVDAEQPKASERALRNILADGVELDVRVRATVPRESELPMGEANTVGVIAWDATRKHALIRVARPTGGWVERGLDFTNDDLPPERGRAAGFALAAMIPSEYVEPRRGATSPNGGTPSTGGVPDPKGGTAPSTAATAEDPKQKTPPAGPQATAATNDTTAVRGKAAKDDGPQRFPLFEPPRYSLEAAGLFGVGLGGEATGIGGAISARRFFARHASLGLRLAARWGTVDAAQATMTHIDGEAMFGYGLPFAQGRAYAGARVSLGASFQHLSHFSGDEASPSSGERLLPLTSAVIEGTWRLQPGVGLRVGIGSEFVLGTTDVYSKGSKVAVLPIARLMGELGLCAFF